MFIGSQVKFRLLCTFIVYFILLFCFCNYFFSLHLFASLSLSFVLSKGVSFKPTNFLPLLCSAFLVTIVHFLDDAHTHMPSLTNKLFVFFQRFKHVFSERLVS